MQTAKVQWIGEQKFVAIGPSGHALAMDSDRSSNTGPGPMELLLMALGKLMKGRRGNWGNRILCNGWVTRSARHGFPPWPA